MAEQFKSAAELFDDLVATFRKEVACYTQVYGSPAVDRDVSFRGDQPVAGVKATTKISAYVERSRSSRRSISDSRHTAARAKCSRVSIRLTPEALAESVEQFTMEAFPDSTAELVVKDANKLAEAMAMMLSRAKPRIEQFLVSFVADLVAYDSPAMLAAAGLKLVQSESISKALDKLAAFDAEDRELEE